MYWVIRVRKAPRAHRQEGRHTSPQFSRTGARWMPRFGQPSKCSTCSQMAALPHHFDGRRGKGSCRGAPTFRGGPRPAGKRCAHGVLRAQRARCTAALRTAVQRPCCQQRETGCKVLPLSGEAAFAGESHARFGLRAKPETRATRTVPVDLGRTHCRALRARYVRKVNCSS